MKPYTRSCYFLVLLVMVQGLVSCGESPEVLRIEAETEDLSEIVKEARQEIQVASEEHRVLRDQHRKWQRSTEMEELEAEVQVLRDQKAEAAAALKQTEDTLEIMKGARLP